MNQQEFDEKWGVGGRRAAKLIAQTMEAIDDERVTKTAIEFLWDFAEISPIPPSDIYDIPEWAKKIAVNYRGNTILMSSDYEQVAEVIMDAEGHITFQ